MLGNSRREASTRSKPRWTIGHPQYWHQYMGTVLEDAVLESVPELRRTGIVKPRPESYGKWWRGGDEIDLVVWDGGSAQFIEVKWCTLTPREATRILEKLREESKKTGITARKEYNTLIAGRLEGQPHLEHGEEALDLDDLGELLGIPRTTIADSDDARFSDAPRYTAVSYPRITTY